jgi:hypothetical protein
MHLLTIILSGGSGNGSNWLPLLLPFALLLIIIKTGQWLNKWIHNYVIPRFFTKKQKHIIEEHTEEVPFSFV